MPPLSDLAMPCSPLVVTTEAYNNTTADPDIDNDDLNALLYIVVTLLFYSLGIVVGIITYLKREKREMEESKIFEMFMSMKNDPFTATKQKRVAVVIERLEQLEKARVAQEERDRVEQERLMEEGGSAYSDREGDSESGEGEEVLDDGDVDSTRDDDNDYDPCDRPADLLVSYSNEKEEDDVKRLQLKKQGNVFQVSPSGEPISSVVAKIFDTERRGGLPNSPKALHLFNGKGRLSRDVSVDSPGRGGGWGREQSVDRISTSGTADADNKSPLVEPEGCLVTNV